MKIHHESKEHSIYRVLLSVLSGRGSTGCAFESVGFNIPRETFDSAIGDLVDWGFAEKSLRNDQTYYYLTRQGRAEFRDMINRINMRRYRRRPISSSGRPGHDNDSDDDFYSYPFWMGL